MVCGGIVGRNNSTGIVSYSCNLGNVTANKVVGGIVGNNRGQIIYTYNMAEEIKAITTEMNSNVGGISGNQNTQSSASISYSYNTGKITGNTQLGGIVGAMASGTVDKTYNLGILNTVNTSDVGQIAGLKYNTSAIKNSNKVTQSDMKSWSQSTVSTNLGNFIKHTNSLPILNITIKDITY